MGTQLSNIYSKKLLDSAKKSTTDALKTSSNRAIQKAAEATGDLIGDKRTDKIRSASKTSQNILKTDGNETRIPKERYISSEKRHQIIDELRLV